MISFFSRKKEACLYYSKENRGGMGNTSLFLECVKMKNFSSYLLLVKDWLEGFLQTNKNLLLVFQIYFYAMCGQNIQECRWNYVKQKRKKLDTGATKLDYILTQVFTRSVKIILENFGFWKSVMCALYYFSKLIFLTTSIQSRDKQNHTKNIKKDSVWATKTKLR